MRSAEAGSGGHDPFPEVLGQEKTTRQIREDGLWKQGERLVSAEQSLFAITEKKSPRCRVV